MGTINSQTLKGIAIAAMLIDHIAWAFVPTASPLGQAMHIIGRITGPTMCFFIAEGYYNTRSVPRYAARLLAFAAVSYLPFIFFRSGALPTKDSFLDLNVMYTLLLGLLALWAWDKIKFRPLAVLIIAGLFFLSIPGDWSVYGVAFILAFGMNRGNFRRQALWFSAACAVMLLSLSLPILRLYPVRDTPDWAAAFARLGGYFPTLFYEVFFQFGVFLPLLLLRRYNGKRGGNRFGKWTFYIFYPAHLAALGALKLLLNR